MAESSFFVKSGSLFYVSDLKVVELSGFRDARGLLVPIEFEKVVTFPPARLFWITEVPPGTRRGAHAHKCCTQLYICCSGSVEVEVFDGRAEQTLGLRAGQTLYLPPLIYSTEIFASYQTLLVVLCSHTYDINDYIRTKQELIDYRLRVRNEASGVSSLRP
jgi:dTDP-4-dehydrorhamnose 3,5-epimerase-like enzyme